MNLVVHRVVPRAARNMNRDEVLATAVKEAYSTPSTCTSSVIPTATIDCRLVFSCWPLTTIVRQDDSYSDWLLWRLHLMLRTSTCNCCYHYSDMRRLWQVVAVIETLISMYVTHFCVCGDDSKRHSNSHPEKVLLQPSHSTGHHHDCGNNDNLVATRPCVAESEAFISWLKTDKPNTLVTSSHELCCCLLMKLRLCILVSSLSLSPRHIQNHVT